MFAMSVAVKCSLFTYRFLNTGSQCVKIVNVRHYPRWTNRRPIGIVEDKSSDELERWKLKIEREIRENDSNETNNSSIIIRKNDTSEAYENLGNSMGRQSTDDAERRYKEYFRVKYKPPQPGGPKEYVVKLNSNMKDVLSENQTELKKQKLSSLKPIEKRKIYSEQEIEIALKQRQSADKLGVPVFTDLGNDDTLLSKYLINVKSRKRREKSRTILLEGKRLINDAINAGCTPEAVFFTRTKDLKYLNLPSDRVKIYKVTYQKLRMWSDVVTPQGIIAVLKIPKIGKVIPASLPLTVICDNVRDPGNLGTILRTCAGVGCEKVILIKGCVDLWEPKVLRASAGAHFRMSVAEADSWDAVFEQVNKDSCVCIAESNTDQEYIQYQNNTSDSNDTAEVESDSDVTHNLESDEYRKGQSELFVAPVLPYYALNYASLPSIALIVGGETEGVSPEAYKFASETSGIRLNIPLSNGVESLNTSIALSVIAFEMKKQFLTNASTKDTNKKERIDLSSDSKASVTNA